MRLGRVTEEDIAELATVAEMRTTSAGGMQSRSAGPTRERDEGVRIDGSILQVGLTEDEIEDVWERLEDLLESIEKGDLGILPTEQYGLGAPPL